MSVQVVTAQLALEQLVVVDVVVYLVLVVFLGLVEVVLDTLATVPALVVAPAEVYALAQDILEEVEVGAISGTVVLLLAHAMAVVVVGAVLEVMLAMAVMLVKDFIME